MAPSELTEVVGAFTDQVAAETLAKFLASLGVSCDVEEVSDYLSQAQPFRVRYGVRAVRSQLDSLKKDLKLSVAAKYSEPIAAEVAAGRLAREGIPSWVGWPHSFIYLWLQAAPIDDGGGTGARVLLVPATFLADAQRVLEQDISDDDLTKLALSYEPPP